MTRLAWATDIHLDFLETDEIIRFAESIKSKNVDGLVLTGDISIAPMLVQHLSLLEAAVSTPIYFVLGNHDYYDGSIPGVRANMKSLFNVSNRLRYLGGVSYLPLTPNTAILGHDGWYDALNGHWQSSRFLMTDWSRIKEFVDRLGSPRMIQNGHLDRGKVVSVAQKIAFECVGHVQKSIKDAVRYHKNIIVCTHVPPFVDACLFQGIKTEERYLPWYTSKLMGDMLLSASKAYPGVSFTVLCGHTHDKFSGNITKNMTCHVGASEYKYPSIQSIIDVK